MIDLSILQDTNWQSVLQHSTIIIGGGGASAIKAEDIKEIIAISEGNFNGKSWLIFGILNDNFPKSPTGELNYFGAEARTYNKLPYWDSHESFGDYEIDWDKDKLIQIFFIDEDKKRLGL